MAQQIPTLSVDDPSVQDGHDESQRYWTGEFAEQRQTVSQNDGNPTRSTGDGSNAIGLENTWSVVHPTGDFGGTFSQPGEEHVFFPSTMPLIDPLASFSPNAPYENVPADMGWLYQDFENEPSFHQFQAPQDVFQADMQDILLDDAQDFSFILDPSLAPERTAETVLLTTSARFTPTTSVAIPAAAPSQYPAVCVPLDGTSEAANPYWAAIQSRSHCNDKLFVFGVTTTRIFCRPSCPSRSPLRKNIIIFPFPGAIEAAMAQGFRPCKRCKPNTIDELEPGIRGVVEALRLIHSDAFDILGTTSADKQEVEPQQQQQPSSKSSQQQRKQEDGAKCTDMRLESLACLAKLSPFHFHRLFKSITLLTPGELITAARSLALGDALGQDSRAAGGASPNPSVLIQKSSKWKARTARKSLGNVSPIEYANGCPSLVVTGNTVQQGAPYGPVSIACHSLSSMTRNEALSQSDGGLLTVLIGSDSEQRLNLRFPGLNRLSSPEQTPSLIPGVSLTEVAPSVTDSTIPDAIPDAAMDESPGRGGSGGRLGKLGQIIASLAEDVDRSDREDDIPPELSPWLWRCRIWVRLVKG